MLEDTIPSHPKLHSILGSHEKFDQIVAVNRIAENSLIVFRSMNSRYGSIAAEFYNITKPIDADYPDVPYTLRKLKKIKGPILEGASGTGRLLIPLLEAGLDVDGVDLSDPMLSWCRKNCAERKLRPKLHKAALETMKLPLKYEAVVLSFGSFMIFDDRKLALQVLKNLYAHLRPGGLLVIDLDVTRPELHRAGLKVYGTCVECSDASTISIEGSKTFDMVEQVERVVMRYERWARGKLVDTEMQHLSLRWYGRYEFYSLLTEMGFENVEVCSDYEEALEPHSETQSLCFSARRPR